MSADMLQMPPRFCCVSLSGSMFLHRDMWEVLAHQIDYEWVVVMCCVAAGRLKERRGAEAGLNSK